MPDWTPQQCNAINARDRNILVSAAAGSGKTAVLVERVITMITDKDNPVDIDKLLIVTFTNAAAAEMKYRISKSLKAILKKNPNDINARNQLSLLSSAKICTIDSFCINLVRENFFDLGINQDFSSMDESELDLMEDRIINDVLDEYFTKDDREFITLIESFTTPNNDKAIITAIKKTLRFIYAQPFPYLWVNSMIEQYNPNTPFEDTIWYKYAYDEIKYLLNIAQKLANDTLTTVNTEENQDTVQKVINVILSDIDKIELLNKKLESSWDEFVSIGKISLDRMASTAKIDTSIAEKIKANRAIYKKILTEDINAFSICSKDEYYDDMKALYPSLQKLTELVTEVDNRLKTEKDEKNSYSFSDIEHFAINLLYHIDNSENIVKTDLADKLSQNYYEILVDEYQDTNEAQDMLFKFLSNGKNLFTVGDVKQSIYRFRLAMPHIFNKKRKEYSYYNENDKEISSKIILDKNFRSKQGICSYVNFVFSNLMSDRVGELEYNRDEFLNYGAKYENNEVPSAQIKLLTGVKGEEVGKKEAAYIAETILDKINSKEQVKDGDTYRDITFGDFAIFMRSLKSHISEYAEVLTSYGIPVICDNSTNLFDNNEIKIILSLLRTIDNPTQDIPLLATMISPIYGFTPDELAQIRIENKQKSFYFSVVNSDNKKVKDFLDDITDLRRLSVTMSVAGFIRYLTEEKGIIALSNAMGNGEQRYQNILKLISFASNFDKGVNVGMTAFIRYIDKIIASDRSVESASLSVSQKDAVTIMSIHHSKGLEFPVCILAGASRGYNKVDLSDKLLLNTNFGFGVKRHNEDKLYQYQSLPYAVIKSKNSLELISENLRVLYVALTRAKEQFITFACCDNPQTKLQGLYNKISNGLISSYVCQKINCDADFLLLCALLHQNNNELMKYINGDVVTIPADFSMSVEICEQQEFENKSDNIEFVEADKNIVAQIENKLSFKYERKELSAVSSKLTASSLDDSENSFEYLTSSKPAFLNSQGMTPAQRGTAMHAFMQFCNYNNAKADLFSEINRLKDNGFITAEQAESLNINKLNSFFNSSFADRMFNSDNIYREIKISSFVKANEIYSTDYDDNILVQGIADCVFEENGELVLVDYKTDSVNSEEELLGRYKKQIAFYKNAVSKALNKNVKEAVLYSFKLEKICKYK